MCTAGGVHLVLNESSATKSSLVENDDMSQNDNCDADTEDDYSLCTAESEDDCKMGLPRNASSALHFEFVTKHSDLQIQILQADVTKFASDGIVNAANGRLRHYGGVAKAISDAAGPELQLECREYIKKHGTITTTDVMHTCSGRLHSQFVIHAVGPVYEESNGQHCKVLLENTFFKVFKYANDNLRLTSLAVPAISAGELLNLY